MANTQTIFLAKTSFPILSYEQVASCSWFKSFDMGALRIFRARFPSKVLLELSAGQICKDRGFLTPLYSTVHQFEIKTVHIVTRCKEEHQWGHVDVARP